MTRIDKVLKNLSDLYEFHRNISAYELKNGTHYGTKLTSGKAADSSADRSPQIQAVLNSTEQ